MIVEVEIISTGKTVKLGDVMKLGRTLTKLKQERQMICGYDQNDVRIFSFNKKIEHIIYWK